MHSQFLVAFASWAGTCIQPVVNNALFQVERLKAKGTVGYGELTSDNAPGDTDTCQHAVANTGLYEAAVNITWLDARQRTKIPFDVPMTKLAGLAARAIYKRRFSVCSRRAWWRDPKLCPSFVGTSADARGCSGCEAAGGEMLQRELGSVWRPCARLRLVC